MTHGTTNTTRLGIAFMLLAVLMFSLNDVMGKWLTSTYSVGQLLFLRGLAALAVLAVFAANAGWRVIFDVSRPWVMAARMLFTALEIGSFYYAVSFMSLADAITFWMAAPIYVAALSPLLLGEQVGWRRWSAIAVGFLGVLIALRPSSETLSAPALVAILGSLCFALMMISGRALRQSSDMALVFWPTLAATVFGAVLTPSHWVTPGPIELAALCLLGIVALLAHYFTNRSLILADAATVTPYQYTLLVWAMIFGWLFFSETPRDTTLIGAALIVASGLYIFFREQRLGHKASQPAVEK